MELKSGIDEKKRGFMLLFHMEVQEFHNANVCTKGIFVNYKVWKFGWQKEKIPSVFFAINSLLDEMDAILSFYFMH